MSSNAPSSLFRPSVNALELNVPQAVIAIAIAVMTADDDASEIERNELAFALRRLRLFRGYEPSYLQEQLRSISLKIKGQEFGVVIGAVKRALTPQLRETAFLIAAELALVDTTLAAKEKVILEKLQTGLEIDAAVGSKIVEVIQIRHRG
jgi:hypothetical protein